MNELMFVNYKETASNEGTIKALIMIIIIIIMNPFK